ncbi:MAG: hypothetical protein KJO31_05110, partial [Gammaproteobacteria bacterium]|nr:hypothetical protein [Gammaproteobacteria bacterium]
ALAAVLMAMLAAACAEPEILQPHSATTPAGVDFAGYWTLRADESGNQRRLREAIDRTDGIDNYRPNSASGRTSRSGRAKGGIVQVFLQVGSSLKVTQTPYALFISFDRYVVEEFRFGENRTVNIGAAEAMRVSGWSGNAYVVETLDKSGMKLTERYELSPDADVLYRHITFRSSKREEESLTQIFDRAPR